MHIYIHIYIHSYIAQANGSGVFEVIDGILSCSATPFMAYVRDPMPSLILQPNGDFSGKLWASGIFRGFLSVQHPCRNTTIGFLSSRTLPGGIMHSYEDCEWHIKSNIECPALLW